nr:transglutaminase domain-containing protein [Chloroflexia bacterium]
MPQRTTTRFRTRPRITLTSPMFPEGLVSLALLLSIVACAGFSVQQADWQRVVVPVPVIALIAAVFGSLLAKLRVLDSLAHLASIVIGGSIAFFSVVAQATDYGASWRERVEPLTELVLGWYVGRESIDRDETYLVSILVGIIVWLMGYLSAWTLFRRGWILVSLLLPGFLILVNLGYASEPDTRYLLIFGCLSVPLVARVHLHVREREWGRHHLAGPRGLSARFVLIGAAVAILTSAIGWRSPASLSQRTFQPLAGEISTQFLSAQDRAAEWIGDRSGAIPVSGGNAGSYSAFDGEFSVGGPLRLSDTPQALVAGDNAPYLAAQRYDQYSGRGWSSTSEQTFNERGEDGRKYSPAMTFGPGQEVPLSPTVMTGRESSSVSVTQLGPETERMLTVDTYLAADLRASVRMAWSQLQDVPLSLSGDALAGLPPDLRTIADLLRSASLTGSTGEGGPGASDPELQRRIEEERRQLVPRFLSVRWTADANGKVDMLHVTGQVPNYEDVDAVFAGQPVTSGSRYEVTGARSRVEDDELASADTAYPAWVRDRYLALPESVTPRTIDLSAQLVGGAANPLEKARVLERYLRTTITYDEQVSAPPEDADLVDYLLFERQRGYCEYYASAMAVMLRSVGVPARVVVGFYPGQFDEQQQGTVYRQKNAHAWVEAFFPGYGWIPFEPTASRPMLESNNDGLGQIASPTATPPLP